jgi:hypothetical protein
MSQPRHCITESSGLCHVCGEPFPCPKGIIIYDTLATDNGEITPELERAARWLAEWQQAGANPEAELPDDVLVTLERYFRELYSHERSA